MTKFFIYPYTMASRSAKALRDELEGKLVLRSGSNYSFKPDHLLINWGCGECPHPKALNYKIMDLIDKVRFFNRLKGTGLTPEYATNKADAKALGYPVFCRTTTQGHDGKGIVIADCDGQLVEAPLYVKGIDKTSEYRVHVGRLPDGTTTILGASKKKKIPVTAEMKNVPSDPRIWCGDTTYFGTFMGQNALSLLPVAVEHVVQEAFGKFAELAFAAFDVIYDNSANQAYVIEANSAPMATTQTTKAYADFFRSYAEQVMVPQPEVQTPVPQPVAAEVSPAAPVPTLTVDDILNRIFLGELSPTKVIEGYINHVQQ
jgi:hypothetical protein